MSKIFIVAAIITMLGCTVDKRKASIAKNNEAAAILSNMHFTRDSLYKAIGLFEKAINIDTTYLMPYSGLLRCYTYLGEREKAINTIRRYISKNDNNLDRIDASIGLAQTYDVAGLKDSADLWYKHALHYGEQTIQTKRTEGYYFVIAMAKNALGLPVEGELLRIKTIVGSDTVKYNFYKTIILRKRADVVRENASKDSIQRASVK